MASQYNIKRVRTLKSATGQNGPVIYWMQRDQRAQDNWALLYAQQLALEKKAPLIVIFSLSPGFLNSPIRHYAFMLKGLKETENSLKNVNIPFYMLYGEPPQTISAFLKESNASALVTDFNPLRLVNMWKDEIIRSSQLPIYEVDAHNIIPCWIASPKLEVGARTLRPKINKLLKEFLTEFPTLTSMQQYQDFPLREFSYENAIKSLNVDRSVKEIEWITPGSSNGMKALQNFILDRLPQYAEKRNDPNSHAQSELSPYFHFGQLAPQRAALELQKIPPANTASVEAYMEEMIVRRELSDNFCFYNKEYDSLEGIPNWAKASLNRHSNDKRSYIYSRKEFESAKTHDPLWNAAQMEMVKLGKMRGYMRMYWAKKILEWTKSPEEAFNIAIYLNDKYELDGRDPNGYAGISWSIGGTHDRPWFDREVYGQIRYMNYEGCKRKFDVKAYIERINSI